MEQNIQETLAIIKPDGIKNSEKIINMIYQNGLKIKEYKLTMLSKEIVREHYNTLLDKPFYGRLEAFMTSDYVILMVLTGENAVEKLRNLMGPTNSQLAAKGTIRGEFGTDITINAIHGSDSVENAKIEIDRFFNHDIKKKTLKPQNI